MLEPQVDVTIAVHSATRPIRRAVASIVEGTTRPVRVNVVAHNIDPAIIRANLAEYADHPAVRLLALRDDIPSPAGPMNLGLDESTAPYVTVMGSDDTLAPGALDAWLALAEQEGASAVLARIELGANGTDPYPPVRFFRTSRTNRLDAVKDRLSYRSAPLGLVRRDAHPALRFTTGLRSGEDLAYSAELWFTGTHLSYALALPAYIVGDDAEDRVTFTARSVAEDFAFLDAIVARPWFTSLRTAARRALVVKIVRVHFFDAVLNRISSPDGLDVHRVDLVALIQRLEGLAPGVLSLLARVDRDVIDEIRRPDPERERILRLLDARWNYVSARAVLPRNLLRVLHRQGPLRTLYAGLRAKQS